MWKQTLPHIKILKEIDFMKRKPVLIVLSLVLGATLLCTTAFANISSSSGYEAYKAAVLNLPQANSLTAQAAVSLTDNGNVVLNADGTMKMDSANKTMSSISTIKAGDKTQSNEMYRQNGQTIMKDSTSDIYNVMEKGPRDMGKNMAEQPATQEVPAEVQNIVDLLAANFDSNISLDNNADGSKVVTLQLADGQITPLENAVASLIAKNANHENKRSNAVMTNLPQLVDAISLTSVDVKAEIDANGQLTGQTAVIKVTGKDASGQVHEIVVNVDVNLSNLNSTTPDTIDLTGKQVVTKTQPHANI